MGDRCVPTMSGTDETEGPAGDDGSLTSPEVAAYARMSFRRVDHAVRQDVLLPAEPANGSGTRRMFDRREARVAWAVARVQDLFPSGVPFDRVRVAAEVLRRVDAWTGYLVSDGRSATVAADENALVVAMSLLGPAVVVVDLDACPPLQAGARP